MVFFVSCSSFLFFLFQLSLKKKRKKFSNILSKMKEGEQKGIKWRLLFYLLVLLVLLGLIRLAERLVMLVLLRMVGIGGLHDIVTNLDCLINQANAAIEATKAMGKVGGPEAPYLIQLSRISLEWATEIHPFYVYSFKSDEGSV